MENNDINELKLPFYCFLALATPEKRSRWELSHPGSPTVSAQTMKYTYFWFLNQHQHAEFSDDIGALNQKDDAKLGVCKRTLSFRVQKRLTPRPPEMSGLQRSMTNTRRLSVEHGRGWWRSWQRGRAKMRSSQKKQIATYLAEQLVCHDFLDFCWSTFGSM